MISLDKVDILKTMDHPTVNGILGECDKCKKCVFDNGRSSKIKNKLFHSLCFTCSACKGPILQEFCEAVGEVYHSKCFTCVVCSQHLAKIDFTLDDCNQLYCIADFHKKYAPRCCICDLPITMPEPGQGETVVVKAFDRTYHVSCYKCEDCGVVLSQGHGQGQACFPINHHILCRNCRDMRVQR